MTKWITGPSRKPKEVFHTDEDCYHLNNAKNVREIEADEIEYHDITECKLCRGIPNDGGGYNEWHEFNQKLRNGEIEG